MSTFAFCRKDTVCYQIQDKKALHFAILWFNDGINFAILWRTLFLKRKIHNKLLE